MHGHGMKLVEDLRRSKGAVAGAENQVCSRGRRCEKYISVSPGVIFFNIFVFWRKEEEKNTEEYKF